MKIQRRHMLKSAAAGSLAGWVPKSLLASTTTNRKLHILLATGLHTDRAFAASINADYVAPFMPNPDTYTRLVSSLSDIGEHRVFCLCDNAENTLLASAARDAGVRITHQSSWVLDANDHYAQSKRIWDLGQELIHSKVSKSLPIKNPPNDGARQPLTLFATVLEK